VVAHDLQEPLRMVAAFVQLLAQNYRGRLDADADEYIGYAVDGAKRMQQLTADLLAYSRVSTRGKEFAPVDCATIVQSVLQSLQLTIEETGAVVTCAPLPLVLGDAAQIYQVFQNLVANALKYRSSAPPRITIDWTPTTGTTGHEGCFSVTDNGIGIEPQYFERIFVVFQRLHTRAEYPGTGIGLAICKKIVERHGGRIWVESRAGAGATFYFTLPRAD
jgi:light-regulated signal transduction histidine kinase (bacteriophytochrome)